MKFWLKARTRREMPAELGVPEIGGVPLSDAGSEPAVLPPLTIRDGGLAFLDGENGYRPLLWHQQGPAIDSLLAGWHAEWVYFAAEPVRLLELRGPGGSLATWFIDALGVRLGDAVGQLAPDLQDGLARHAAGLLQSEDPRGLAARAEYRRIAPATRLQIEALLPNATYDRSLELAQGLVAGSPAHLRKSGAITLSFTDGWIVRETAAGPARIACGPSSRLAFEAVPQSSAYFFSLRLGALGLSRRLQVVAGGRTIAISPLHGRFHREFSRFCMWVPPELVRQGRLEITLEHGLVGVGREDEAFILQDATLELGDPVATAFLPDDVALMQQFQSVGDNCQFGFVQRHFGAEPMGLLRFAGLPDLIGMLDARMAGLGDPGTVGQLLSGIEYQIHETRYGMFYHSFRNVGSITPEALIAENETKLRYLARKLIEDLEDGQTIWLTRRIVSNDVSEILALHAALCRYGPNRLFWVTPAANGRRAGEVEWISRDILRGYLAEDAVNDPTVFTPADWLALCRAAFLAFGARPG